MPVHLTLAREARPCVTGLASGASAVWPSWVRTVSPPVSRSVPKDSLQQVQVDLEPPSPRHGQGRVLAAADWAGQPQAWTRPPLHRSPTLATVPTDSRRLASSPVHSPPGTGTAPVSEDSEIPAITEPKPRNVGSVTRVSYHTLPKRKGHPHQWALCLVETQQRKHRPGLHPRRGEKEHPKAPALPQYLTGSHWTPPELGGPPQEWWQSLALALRAHRPERVQTWALQWPSEGSQRGWPDSGQGGWV